MKVNNAWAKYLLTIPNAHQFHIITHKKSNLHCIHLHLNTKDELVQTV